jgi:PAS domain S-box-containing protein
MKIKFLFLQLFLVATILVVGGLFFQYQVLELRRSTVQSLTSVSDLKANEIAVWLSERKADASVVESSRIVKQLLKTPNNSEMKSAVREYFDTLCNAYHYEAITLLDSHESPLLASPNDSVFQNSCKPSHIRSLLSLEDNVLTDLHRSGPNEPIHFSLLFQIKDGLEPNAPAIGFVLMAIDPYKFLYPFIQSWPTPSQTAETMLVRGEGKDVLFLNDLRHLKGAALNLRVDDSHTDVIGVRAAVQGERGVLKGLDYRGMPVTAVATDIPGTPWVMIAKMDQTEIDAPARKGAWVIGLITGLTTITTLLIFALLWRQQRLAFTRREMASLAETERALRSSEERFRAIFQGSAYGIVLADPITRKFVLCNEAICKMTGYRAEELTAMGVPDMHPSDDLPAAMEGFDKLLHGKIDLIRGMRVLRKDGSIFFADISTTLIPIENVTYLAGFFWDVTKLIQAEQEIQDSRNFLDSIIDQSPISMFITDGNGTLIRLNQACCDIMRVTPEEVVEKYNLLEDNVVAEKGITPLIRSVFEEGKVVSFDLTYDTARLTGLALNQTAVMDLNVTIFPIRDRNDRITNAVVQHIDVTERKQTVERLRRLSELQAVLHDPIDLDQKLKRITDAVITIFGADFARIWLTSRGDLCSAGCVHAEVTDGPHVCRYREKCLHLRASSGRYTHLDGASHSRIPFGCYKIGRIASGLESSFLTNDVTHDPRVHNHAWAKDLGLVSFAGYQLCLPQGEKIGVMGLFSKHAISPEEDALLQNLSNLIVPVIQAAQNEKTLRESEEKYRGIFDESIAAIYIFDTQKRFLDSNQAGLDLLGYTRKELLGMSITEMEAEPDVVLRAYAELMSRDRFVNYEHKLRRKDGAIITVLNNSRVLKGSDDTITGMLSTLFNITIRKQAEIALQESRNLMKLVLDTVPQAVFWKDIESRYIGCNRAFARSAGLDDPTQIAGKTDYDLPWPRHEADAYRADDRAVIDSGEPKRHIIEPLEQADGTRLWIDTSKVPFIDQAGCPIGILGVYEDITERKQMEEDLQSRNEELARFVYTVSHDLKSPLVTIQTFLGYLGKDLASNDNERVTSDIGYIGRAAVKMNELLEGLLELSRVGRKMNPPEDLPFRELVHTALDAVAGQIAERQVEIDLSEAKVLLHGDRLRLSEVFQNLIDNAVKFMGNQIKPRIEIGVDRVDGETVFYVRDNGLGIDPRHLGKLFGLFEKLHPGTPGTGMGLALIKRIVEVHGGRIWAESAGPGQGTTIRFTLQGTKAF